MASYDDDHFILSAEQQRVVNLIDLGENVFFTGAAGNLACWFVVILQLSVILYAGTGKSYLLRSIIKRLRSTMENKSIDVAITATTGVAGLNIGGMTIHSFAGFGLGKGKQEDLAEKVNRSAKSRNRWCQTRILIIDESQPPTLSS